ncbi:di-trans,poly-cis-decaprenylcistransferase [Candidatus Woesebacteria bacterium]|jgi:undecaprenyl diphosphate synthase|nr:di-trans,poly-cis-decaprenylcistransferase [Candidatus Woesebacteria bacterium]HOA11767.1 polyprenyl diphosphate synthase [Candidatus Woesebacteria bacterium]HOC07446.1 polyprenyl diphosphate synthase [Candidatus Woesebacteria bacterium]HOI04864.1 polyprenyl diphosphate synthase [Candidatus Woesebacteria bacterium]HOP38852.1 polyprenyl diphosphate synthase [Candidatus Woesebacteria bacterium]
MQTANIPQHVAIIMDGNRRWARKQGLAIIKGHRQTAEETIERLADYAIKVGIKFLTLWAFSTENWNREQTEVEGIMNLFRETFSTATDRLHEKGIRIHTIGDLSPFPQDIRAGIEKWKRETAKNNKLVVTFALNYGGRDEIVRAINRLITEKKNTKNQKITAEMFENYLDTRQEINLPDPELIIRPGGEQRLSGYLPWQGVYSELYFCDTLMPDFDEQEFAKALDAFAHRQRRFGQ